MKRARLGWLALLLSLTLSPAWGQGRVLFLGEQHTREADHRAQLDALQTLDRTHPVLLVAEMFTERAESELTAWNQSPGLQVEETLWQREWGYPYPLYDALFRWAKEAQVPVVWLRPDPALTQQVKEKGPASVVPRIEELLLGPSSYRDFMAQMAGQHGGRGGQAVSDETVDRYFLIQCFWDEFMAWRLLALHRQHPEATLVVLVGDGHLRPGEGIPWRLQRRAPELPIEVRRALPEPPTAAD